MGQIINWVQVENGSEVQKVLQELYDTYKTVEIIAITESRTFNIFYKIGEAKS